MARRFFGWKPSPPDHRDIYFSAPRSFLSALPPRIDLTEGISNSVWNPVWNQGQLGSCGPHSSCADIVFAALKQQNLPLCPMPSRLFVYYTTRLMMGTVNQDSGVDNRSMMKALSTYGWCDESMWPYDISKFRKNPPLECYKQAENRKIQSYLAVRQTLEDMKACLAGGDPFIFGFSVYESIEEAENTGIIPYPKRNERVIGGHDVQFVGYDDATQMFKLRNSWDGWGQDGYGWIPFKYATNPNLATDFWTIIHSSLPDINPPPPPQPPQPPVPPIASKGKIVVEIDWTNHAVDGVSVV